jgi:dUTP pyrophosphatase
MKETRLVGVKRLNESVEIPRYATEGSSGADIKLNMSYDFILEPGDSETFNTGLSLDIPDGMEVQIRSRSGWAQKGLVVLNQPGTVDSDYRGELKVILMNVSKEPITITKEDYIAQLVLSPVIHMHFYDKYNMIETGRGYGGFGSTGY